MKPGDVIEKRNEAGEVEEKVTWNPHGRVVVTIGTMSHIIGEMMQMPDGKWAYYKRTSRDKHLFRKLNAYGLNYLFLSILPGDTEVIVDEMDGDMYKSTVKEILQNGTFLNFKKEGYELQIFMPLDQFRRSSR